MKTFIILITKLWVSLKFGARSKCLTHVALVLGLLRGFLLLCSSCKASLMETVRAEGPLIESCQSPSTRWLYVLDICRLGVFGPPLGPEAPGLWPSQGQGPCPPLRGRLIQAPREHTVMETSETTSQRHNGNIGLRERRSLSVWQTKLLMLFHYSLWGRISSSGILEKFFPIRKVNGAGASWLWCGGLQASLSNLWLLLRPLPAVTSKAAPPNITSKAAPPNVQRPLPSKQSIAFTAKKSRNSSSYLCVKTHGYRITRLSVSEACGRIN